jgi:hypothetical protein
VRWLLTILRESFSFNLANKIHTLIKSELVGPASVVLAKRPTEYLVNRLDFFVSFLSRKKKIKEIK